MQAHGGPGGTVVDGTEPFTPLSGRTSGLRSHGRGRLACRAHGPSHRSPARRRHRARDRRAGRRGPRSWGTSSSTEHLFGGASIDAHGTPLTDEVLAACRDADAVLLAAVGGPEMGHHRSRARRAPSRACSGCARASACSPTCARSGRSPRWSTPPR